MKTLTHGPHLRNVLSIERFSVLLNLHESNDVSFVRILLKDLQAICMISNLLIHPSPVDILSMRRDKYSPPNVTHGHNLLQISFAVWEQ